MEKELTFGEAVTRAATCFSIHADRATTTAAGKKALCGRWSRRRHTPPIASGDPRGSIFCTGSPTWVCWAAPVSEESGSLAKTC